jgi:Predicted periplasmic/secreted protein
MNAQDILHLQAQVAVEIVPDVAVMTLLAEASGAEPASLTREVQQAIEAGLSASKENRAIEARTGSFSTQPRWGPRGTREGWTVRAELVLKSKDFAALGSLAGRLAQQKLMITTSGFEISRELREREEAALIEQGIQAFRNKASTAARAFGFSSYSLREVTLGTIGGDIRPHPRPYELRAAAASVAAEAPPVAIEGGKVSLSLTVSGAIQMSR